MKQPGIFFALFCGFYLVLAERKENVDWRKIGGKVIVFSLGVCFPSPVCFFSCSVPASSRYFVLDFFIARQYSSSIGIADGIQMLSLYCSE